MSSESKPSSRSRATSCSSAAGADTATAIGFCSSSAPRVAGESEIQEPGPEFTECGAGCSTRRTKTSPIAREIAHAVALRSSTSSRDAARRRSETDSSRSSASSTASLFAGASLTGARLLHRRGDVLDLPGDDLGLDLVHLADLRLRHCTVDLAEADAVVLQAVDDVAAVKRSVHDGLDRPIDRGVDALRRARQHVLRVEERLVRVDADRPDVLFRRRANDADPTSAGDLEHDSCTLVDLVERERLAEVLARKVLRVRVQHLDAGICGFRAGLVARDEAIDRRLLLSAH